MGKHYVMHVILNFPNYKSILKYIPLSCIKHFIIEYRSVMCLLHQWCWFKGKAHLYPGQAAREGAVQEAGLVGQHGGALQDDGVGVQTGGVLHHHELCAWRQRNHVHGDTTSTTLTAGVHSQRSRAAGY